MHTKNAGSLAASLQGVIEKEEGVYIGWTSVKYNGITLKKLREQLEDLQAKSELLKKSPNKNETTSSKDSISSSSSSSSTTSSTSSSSSSSTTSATVRAYFRMSVETPQMLLALLQ